MLDTFLDDRKRSLSNAGFALSEEGKQVMYELRLESKGRQAAIVPLEQRKHRQIANMEANLLSIDTF